MSEEIKTTLQSSPPLPRPPLPPIPSPRGRSTLSRVLPTDRVAFEKQKELLRAFAAEYTANGGLPVTNEKAGEIVSLSGSTISQTNGFFCDIELVKRAEQGGFVPVPEVIAYNNACQWDETEARAKLRPIFEKTWFYRCLIPRLHIAPQTKAICLSILAGESKAQPEHNERLVCLINFLELAGIISEVGGMVSLQQTRPPVQDSAKEDNKSIPAARGNTTFTDQEDHSLFLDKDKKRKFSISSPLFITRAEYQRICKWIEVTLIVDDPENK